MEIEICSGVLPMTPRRVEEARIPKNRENSKRKHLVNYGSGKFESENTKILRSLLRVKKQNKTKQNRPVENIFLVESEKRDVFSTGDSWKRPAEDADRRGA
jgi:hypothetical protein